MDEKSDIGGQFRNKTQRKPGEIHRWNRGISEERVWKLSRVQSLSLIHIQMCIRDSHMTLNPGDVIALGDIGEPETIVAGQTMEAIIPQIGVLKNKTVNEKVETGICPGGAMGQ